MSRLALALLLTSVGATILTHSKSSEYSPRLIPYVLRTKEQLCAKSNTTVLISLDGAVENLRNELVRTVPGKIVIGNEGLLFGRKDIPKVDCGIILIKDLITQLEYAWINFKTIVLVRVENLQQNFGYDGRHVHHVYIPYTKDAYTVIGQGPPQSNHFLQVMFYPTEATGKAFVHVWTSMALRYNLSFLTPIPVRLDTVSAYSTGIFSLKRTEHVVCYLVPLRSKRPLEYVLIFPFDGPTWCLILLVILITMVLLWKGPRVPRDLIEIVFEIIQGVLSSPNLHTGSSFERHIQQMFMFAVLIFATTYLSLITAFIATPFYYDQYDTLDQINDSCIVATAFIQDTSKFDFKHEIDYMTALQQDIPVCLPISCHILRNREKFYTIGRMTYCLSPAKSHEQPLLGVVRNPKYSRIAQLMASTFVEGDLHHFDDDWKLKDKDRSAVAEINAFDMNDLRIVWSLTTKGWIISCSVFGIELLLSCLKRMFSARKSTDRVKNKRILTWLTAFKTRNH